MGLTAWVFRKLFGTPAGYFELRHPWRSIEGLDHRDPAQFAVFMRGLPHALPQAAVLLIRPSSRTLYDEYRKLEGQERVLPGGLLAKSKSLFCLSLSTANIERICELRHKEMQFSLAMNINVLNSADALMDWCVTSFHSPWFSAGVDVEKLRMLAEQCGGTLSEAMTPDTVPRRPWIEFRDEPSDRSDSATQSDPRG